MSLLRNFYASRKSRERRRRTGQDFSGTPRDAPTHGIYRSRFEGIINFFFLIRPYSRTFSLNVSSSTISVCIHVPSIIPSLFPSFDCFVYASAYSTYARNNESERTEHRKRGIRGRDMQEEFDRPYRKTRGGDIL